jgi:8-oxo-dGTP diphosphatase
MSKNKLKTVILAIVKNDDDDVLIVRRKNPEHIKGVGDLLWVFPGGALPNSHEHEEYIIDETLAETGHYVEVVSKVSERKYPKNAVHLHYYECSLTTDASTQLIDDHEIVQYAWVKPSRLMEDYFEVDMDTKVAKFLGL